MRRTESREASMKRRNVVICAVAAAALFGFMIGTAAVGGQLATSRFLGRQRCPVVAISEELEHNDAVASIVRLRCPDRRPDIQILVPDVRIFRVKKDTSCDVTIWIDGVLGFERSAWREYKNCEPELS
jgi:hypothetical protein